MPQATPLPWNSSAAAHLLSRAGFGGRPSECDELARLSRDAAVDQILQAAIEEPAPKAPEWVKDPWVNTERRFTHTLPEAAGKAHGMANRRYGQEIADLRRWWIGLMLSSPVPLCESMTLFWHGHFASGFGKVLISQAMFEQNATLRKHALGNFRTMLRAVTLDAAMMIYLDLEDSEKTQPNENFARELYELFALGHGHYTETDIRETARALSGWTLDAPPGTEIKGETAAGTNRRFTRDGLVARFREEHHDGGQKTVFGKSGPFGVDQIVEMTVSHPACATFLAGKLLANFGCDDPEGRVQKRMADAFTESQFEIAPMLRVLLTSDEFHSESSRGAVIKSPVRLLVGACRQLELEVANPQALLTFGAAMGQELFNPPNVKGWPGGESWISAGTLALRYHAADVLLDGKKPEGMDPIGIGRGRPSPLPVEGTARERMMQMMGGRREGEQADPPLGTRLDPAKLFPKGVPADPGALAAALCERLLVIPPRAALAAALKDAIAAAPLDRRVDAGVRLLLVSPEFQVA